MVSPQFGMVGPDLGLTMTYKLDYMIRHEYETDITNR